MSIKPGPNVLVAVATETAAAATSTDVKPVVSTKKPDVRSIQADNIQVLHHLTSNQLLQGIMLSEVLGKPISMRRGHRRP